AEKAHRSGRRLLSHRLGRMVLGPQERLPATAGLSGQRSGSVKQTRSLLRNRFGNAVRSQVASSTNDYVAVRARAATRFTPAVSVCPVFARESAGVNLAT